MSSTTGSVSWVHLAWRVVRQTTSASLSASPKHRQAAFLLLGVSFELLLYTLLVGLITYFLAVTFFTPEAFLPNKKKKKKGENDPAMLGADVFVTTAITTAGVNFSAIGAALLTGLTNTSANFFTIVTALRVPLIVLVGVAVAAGAMHVLYPVIVPWVHSQLSCRFYSFVHYVVHPVVDIGLIVYQTLYGVLFVALTLLKTFPPTGTGWLRYVFMVALPSVGGLLHDGATIALTFIRAVGYFIAQNPITGEPLFYDTFQAIFAFIINVSDKILNRFCYVLWILVGGILRGLGEGQLALALDYAVRFAWKTFTEFIVLPLLELRRPSVDIPYDRQTKAFTALARAAQNVITYAVAEWSDETLIGKVNGSIPMPTDSQQYAVRALRERLFEAGAEWLNLLAALAIWEPLALAFKADILVTSQGRDLWRFDRVTKHAILVLRNLATLIDIAPTCSNDFATNVPFGNILALGEMAIWAIRVFLDVAVGEVYAAIFDDRKIGFFLAQYLQFEDSSLKNYEEALNRGFRAGACIIGFADRYLATSVDSTATTLLFYLPRVLIQILAYTRYVLTTRLVGILDNVSIDELAARFVDIAGLGEIFFQFEPNHPNEAQCAQQLRFFCALGIFGKYLPLIFLRLIVLVLRGVVNIIKTVLNLFYYQSVSTYVAPDFDEVVNTIDTAACYLGVSVATFFPINIPCSMPRGSFCHTTQFPSPENTFGACLGTTFCTLFRALVSPVRGFVKLYKLVVQFQAIQNAVTGFVKVVSDFVIYDVVTIPCPAAHLFDCGLSAFVPAFAGQTPTTDFICPLMAFTIQIFKEVRDLFIDAIRWLFRVFGFLSNPFLEGNPISTLFGLMFDLFRIVAVSLGDILKRILGWILYAVITVVFKVCQFFNNDNDPATPLVAKDGKPRACDGLRELLQGLQGALGEIPTDPDNYKRSVRAFMEATSGATPDRCYAVPYLQSLFRILYPDISNEKLANLTVCADVAQSMNTTDFRIYQIMGEGVRDHEDLVPYLYERIAWTPGTTCARLMYAYRNTRRSDLPEGDRITIQKCAEDVVTMAAAQSLWQGMEWLPLDLKYNEDRKYLMVGQAAQFTLAAIQWSTDRAQPLAVLLNDTYINSWASLGMDTRHYARWRAAYPGPNAPSYLYTPLIQTIQQRSLMDNVREALPHYFNSSAPGGTLEMLADGMYETTSRLLKGILDERYDQALAIVAANESARLITEGYHANGSYVRDAYGSQADSQYNERIATISFMELLARGYMIAYNGAKNLSTLWYEEKGNTNFKRSVEGTWRAARVAWHNDLEQDDPEIHDAWSRVKRAISHGWTERVNDIRQALAKKPSGVGESVVGFAELALARHGHDEHVQTLCDPQVRDNVTECRAALADLGHYSLLGRRTKRSVDVSEATARDPRTDVPVRPLEVNTTQSVWSWIVDDVFAARTERARNNRAHWSNVWQAARKTVWNTYYVLFGDEDAVEDRMQRVIDGTVPTLTQKRDIPELQEPPSQTNEELYAAFAEWRDSAGAHASAQSAQSAWDYMTTTLGRPASTLLAQEWLGETHIDPNTGHPMAPPTLKDNTTAVFGNTRLSGAEMAKRLREKRLVQQNTLREWLAYQSDREHLQELFDSSEAYMKKYPRDVLGGAYSFRPRSVRMRRMFGLQTHFNAREDPMGDRVYVHAAMPLTATAVAGASAGARAYRIDGRIETMRAASVQNTSSVAPSRVIMVPRTSRLRSGGSQDIVRAVQHGTIDAAFFFDDSNNVLQRQCGTSFTALCENCWALDIALGIVLTQVTFGYWYYTGPYATFMSTFALPFLPYTLDLLGGAGNVSNPNTTYAIAGNGTNSPWLFARDEPLSTMLQFSPNEVAEGLDLFRWVRVALNGAALPSLRAQTGILYTKISAYVTLRDAGLTKTSRLYDILWYIQTTMGLRIIDVLDTLYDFVTVSGFDLGEWIYDRFRICPNTPPRQIYSWAGGAIVVLTYGAVITLVGVPLLNAVLPALVTPFVVTLMFIAIPVHIVITYEWSVICVLPPPAYFIDAVRFLFFVILDKCPIWTGAYISDENYTAATCARCHSSPPIVDCEKVGFENEWDALTYLQVWLGGDWVGTVQSIYRFIVRASVIFDADVEPTHDWTVDAPQRWAASARASPNYAMCALQTTAAYGSVSLVVALFVAILVVSALPSIFSIVSAVFTFYVSIANMFLFLELDVTRRVQQSVSV